MQASVGAKQAIDPGSEGPRMESVQLHERVWNMPTYPFTLSSSVQVLTYLVLTAVSEAPRSLLVSESKGLFQLMKKGKSPGKNILTAEML